LNDLKESSQLLPLTSQHVVIPNKAAAFAMLSRVYLSMRDYTNALAYADSSLLLRNYLMNFNNDPNVDMSSSYPFIRYNPEVLYLGGALLESNFTQGVVDSTLYSMYSENDLRRSLYFYGLRNVL